MNNFLLADELERAIEAGTAAPVTMDSEMRELVGIAGELQALPYAEFRSELKADLLRRMAARAGRGPQRISGVVPRTVRASLPHTSSPEALPLLFGLESNGFPLHQRSFAASLAMHVTALALVVASGVWAANHEQLKPRVTTSVIFPGDYALPPASDENRGGGGGGTHEEMPASNGHPPRLSAEQLTPPAIVVQNFTPRLTAEPTVIGPPDVKFPQMGPMGDPLSAAVVPSNGPGGGGGIGNNYGSGDGPGKGPGVGPGIGGGFGGDYYRPGGGVSAPRAIYQPEPEYSEEARKAKYQGNVVLWVVVGADGRPRDVRVQRSLGMGLDEKAEETVRTWRFIPAMKDGRPVAVQVDIEVEFRLY